MKHSLTKSVGHVIITVTAAYFEQQWELVRVMTSEMGRVSLENYFYYCSSDRCCSFTFKTYYHNDNRLPITEHNTFIII